MRGVCAKVLTAGLIVLAASPAFAQPRPGGPPGGPPGGFQITAAMLLRNDKVMEELKITDDQKADLKKAGDKVAEKYRDEFGKAQGDFQKIGDLFKAQNEDTEKAMLAVLKADQAKRLKQLVVQAAGLDAFSRDDVQSALKLTDKQKSTVKDEQDGLQKDIRDLFQDARNDREKMAAAGKKVQDMRADTMAKVVKGLTDEQQKTWKDLNGDKFDVAALGGGGFGFGGGIGGFGPGGPGGFPGGPGGFPGGPGGFGGFGGPPQPGTVLTAPVQDTLKLSDDQKKQLADLQKDVDTKLDKILTDDQKKQLKDMRDRRPGGFPGGPPGGPGGPPRP
jgi:Spy/CpxP family protein refolding chaperone